MQAEAGVVGRVEDEDAQDRERQGAVAVEVVMRLDVWRDLGLEVLEERGRVEARDDEGFFVDFRLLLLLLVILFFVGRYRLQRHDPVSCPFLRCWVIVKVLDVCHSQLI